MLPKRGNKTYTALSNPRTPTRTRSAFCDASISYTKPPVSCALRLALESDALLLLTPSSADESGTGTRHPLLHPPIFFPIPLAVSFFFAPPLLKLSTNRTRSLGSGGEALFVASANGRAVPCRPAIPPRSFVGESSDFCGWKPEPRLRASLP